jgi:hypothetical protein
MKKLTAYMTSAVEEKEMLPELESEKDPFETLYQELLKKPQGDVMVARIKAFLAK